MSLIYPVSYSLKMAGIMATALENSTLHLLTNPSFAPTTGTLLGNLTEANFYGYGAISITAFGEPYFAPTGGSSLTIFEQFNYGTNGGSQEAENIVTGYYLQDADGNLVVSGDLPATAMTQLGDSIPLQISLNFGS